MRNSASPDAGSQSLRDSMEGKGQMKTAFMISKTELDYLSVHPASALKDLLKERALSAVLQLLPAIEQATNDVVVTLELDDQGEARKND